MQISRINNFENFKNRPCFRCAMPPRSSGIDQMRKIAEDGIKKIESDNKMSPERKKLLIESNKKIIVSGEYKISDFLSDISGEIKIALNKDKKRPI